MSSARVVVITGGASGIGLGISEAFARDGQRVAMLDVQEENLARESARLREGGGTIFAHKVDVASRASIEAAYAAVRVELGPIEVVVANAGIAPPHDVLTMPAEAWQRMIDINLTGVFHTIQAALADMVEAQWGRIITISSQAGQGGAPGRVHYSAAKAGVIGMTKALAAELGRHNITVNTIPPAVVDTPLMRRSVAAGEVPPLEAITGHLPIRRPGLPADIANVCTFLASDASSYITGQQIAANGGSYM